MSAKAAGPVLFWPVLRDVLLTPTTQLVLQKPAWFRPVRVSERAYSLH